jgi:hypothetical protein
MRRITLWITTAGVIIALFVAYQLNLSGGGKEDDRAQAAPAVSGLDATAPEDASRPGYTPGHADKPGEGK